VGWPMSLSRGGSATGCRDHYRGPGATGATSRAAQIHSQPPIMVPGHLDGVHLGHRDVDGLFVPDELADRDPVRCP
jgi:hypothetical protein